MFERYEVEFYRSWRGDSPIEEFIEGLQPKAKARIVHTLELLEQFGPDLSMPHVKKLSGKLWELRVSHANNKFRFLYFGIGRRFVVVHGFIKKTAKTPKRDLALAESRMKEMLEKMR